jgi:hypothetical protein
LSEGVTYRQPARRASPATSRILAAGLLVIGASIAATRGYQWLVPSSATAAAPVDRPHDEPGAVPTTTGAAPVVAPRSELPARPSRQGDALGEADGAVPDGTTVFDDHVPGVAKLRPALLATLRRAATDAAGDGVKLDVDSGWRSPTYQEHLLREAISKYGSETEAARWVATPATSAHVSGEAIDLGPVRATAWLSRHGATYGLCQVYRNEPWHYELRPQAVDHGCPPMYADASHDPRMQQR